MLQLASRAQGADLSTWRACREQQGRIDWPKHLQWHLLIDQTTKFDSRLKQAIADNVRPFLKPGNAFSVMQFSAFTQGHYTRVLVSGKLDPVLGKAARDSVSKPVLNKFDQCMAGQSRSAGQLVGGAIKAAFGGSSNDVAKSDIFTSLKNISGKVRLSTAKRKVVLLASDMLENSSITSFYAKHSVRQINPKKNSSWSRTTDCLAILAVP